MFGVKNSFSVILALFKKNLFTSRCKEYFPRKNKLLFINIASFKITWQEAKRKTLSKKKYFK